MAGGAARLAGVNYHTVDIRPNNNLGTVRHSFDAALLQRPPAPAPEAGAYANFNRPNQQPDLNAGLNNNRSNPSSIHRLEHQDYNDNQRDQNNQFQDYVYSDDGYAPRERSSGGGLMNWVKNNPGKTALAVLGGAALLGGLSIGFAQAHHAIEENPPTIPNPWTKKL